MLLSVIFYILSLVFAIAVILHIGRINNRSGLTIIPPILFVLILALYVLPLPVRVITTETNRLIEGNISYRLYEFLDYMPWAVMFCSLFNILFVLFYQVGVNVFHKKRRIEFIRRENFLFKYVFGLLILIALFMLNQLAASFGGIINMILLGYKVTEAFLGKKYFAIAFEWLVSLGVLFFLYAYTVKSKKLKTVAWGYIAVLFVMFLIMGRRGVMVMLGLSMLFAYHTKVKPIKFRTVAIIGFLGFLLLNFVGLLRGDSYDSFGGIIDTISDKSSTYKENQVFENNLFYTVTSGNFAIPFETLPLIMKGFGTDFNPGFGLYSLQSASLVIPNFIWSDRPLPLSNWYMEQYYGGAESNIGRQFFILTSFYMDYGPLGILFISLILGLLFAWMSRILVRIKNDYIKLTIYTLLLGNFFNIISNDIVGFFVYFAKTSLIPIIILAFFTKKNNKIAQ